MAIGGPHDSYPDWQGMQNRIDQIGTKAKGWQCPSCSRCYSPLVSACTNCGPSDPPFVNDHPRRAIECNRCGFLVRPGYVHRECNREGIPVAEWLNGRRGDCE